MTFIGEAAVGILASAVIALIAYIFISFRSDTGDRLRHQDKLLETAIASSVTLTEIVNRHDLELKLVKQKLRIKI